MCEETNVKLIVDERFNSSTWCDGKLYVAMDSSLLLSATPQKRQIVISHLVMSHLRWCPAFFERCVIIILPAVHSHVKQFRFRLMRVVDWDSEARISGATGNFPQFRKSRLAIVGRSVSTCLFDRGYLSSSNPASVWPDRTGQGGDQAGYVTEIDVRSFYRRANTANSYIFCRKCLWRWEYLLIC